MATDVELVKAMQERDEFLTHLTNLYDSVVYTYGSGVGGPNAHYLTMLGVSSILHTCTDDLVRLGLRNATNE